MAHSHPESTPAVINAGSCAWWRVDDSRYELRDWQDHALGPVYDGDEDEIRRADCVDPWVLDQARFGLCRLGLCIETEREWMREMAGLFLADYVQRVEAALTALELPLDYAARYQLPIFSEAPALEHAGTDVFGRARLLEPAACRAWLSMRETAHGDGVALELVSAYRSFEYQVGLVRAKREAGQSTKDILRSSAAPGFSEHHTGRAIDVALPGGPVLEEAFESSSGFDWLQRHAESFGFYLSYPRDNHHGITYEPWHWCYRDGTTT